jgi:GNAT superfamily N-acetyltransferase
MQIFSISGREVEPYLPALAQLRIRVFREFPYLYEGTMAAEEQYLLSYRNSQDSLLVIAQDGESIVGVSTALPLTDHEKSVHLPFLENGYDLAEVFYYGESVLLPEYRKQGIGVAFFQERESFAKQLQRFKWAAFCGVVRSKDHPLRPTNYEPLDEFWKKRGFQPTDMYAQMEWQDIDEQQPSSKSLRFWLKAL